MALRQHYVTGSHTKRPRVQERLCHSTVTQLQFFIADSREGFQTRNANCIAAISFSFLFFLFFKAYRPSIRSPPISLLLLCIPPHSGPPMAQRLAQMFPRASPPRGGFFFLLQNNFIFSESNTSSQPSRLALSPICHGVSLPPASCNNSIDYQRRAPSSNWPVLCAV